MVAWIPILKASLPYIGQIVGAAIPAFTSKPEHGKSDEIIPQQIAELQTAVTHNAESVKALATQLKEAIQSIDAGAAKLQQEITRLRRLALLAVLLAVFSTSAALWAIAS